MRIERRYLRALKGLAAAVPGERLFAVGGCVRDGLLGRTITDLDLMTEGDAASLARAFVSRRGGSFEVFDRFGTVRLSLPGGGKMDIARARAEDYPSPAVLPVVRPARIEEDLKRRDFTVNAMARPWTPRGWGELFDPFGGREDLNRRRLRLLHPASFRDDPTRLFRGARYAGRLSLRPDAACRDAIAEAVRRGWPGLLSRERIRQETVRILEEKDPGPAMARLKRWGLLPAIHPAFRWSPAALKVRGAAARLGVCALAMPRGEGLALLDALPLSREESGPLREALRIRDGGMSPKAAPAELTKKVLAVCRPDARPAALGRLLVGGEDLRKLGLAPGRSFSEWLDRAARKQWRGEFSTRKAALAWLKKAVSGR